MLDKVVKLRKEWKKYGNIMVKVTNIIYYQ